MLPSKSCKTINANVLLKNFGQTFFDRFKTGTYLVNWFGHGSADRTSKFGRYRCRFIGRSLVLRTMICILVILVQCVQFCWPKHVWVCDPDWFWLAHKMSRLCKDNTTTTLRKWATGIIRIYKALETILGQLLVFE